MKDEYDIIVVGAGPAGMAAAQLASNHGAAVLLLNDQAELGGQIYRHIEQNNNVEIEDILGIDYLVGHDLVKALKAGLAEIANNSPVWQITPDENGAQIGLVREGQAVLVRAKQLILATGAMERPVPLNGWTLAGVMSVGAAQTLLKSSGVVADQAIFAGCGPLLYLTAAQYVRAGTPPIAILDTTPLLNYADLVWRPSSLVGGNSMFKKGAALIREIKSAAVPIVRLATDLSIQGESAATGISYRRLGWTEQISASHIFLHSGIVPNIHLAEAGGCQTEWDGNTQCWNLVQDEWGQSSVASIHVAGDGASIGGAESAPLTGRISAISALYKIGLITIDQRNGLAENLRKKRKQYEKIRRGIDRLFRPSNSSLVPTEKSTIVCRCEEITRAEIENAIEIGAVGPNQIKAYTRCGMGPCQGRFCEMTIAEIMAKAAGLKVQDVGRFSSRFPASPIRLSALKALDHEDDDEARHSSMH